MLIDVSHFQGVINWATTDPAIDGAYMKITEGSSNVDSQWSANHSGTVLHGKPAGAYHFADLGNPVTEANHFADQYLTSNWQLHPVLDIETNGATANWIVQFRDQFRARTGFQDFRVYSSYSLLTGALNPAGWIDSNTTIWAARYNSTLGWNHPQLVLWQNTSSANIPGVVGHVDDDQFMNGWTPGRDTGSGGTPPPPPPPVSGGGTPVTGTIPAGTVLHNGSTGTDVKILQTALNVQYPAYSHLTIDGSFGPATEAVVKEFQQRAGLTVDGVAGPQTLGALHVIATPAPTPAPTGVVLHEGSTGEAVRTLQHALNTQYPAYSHLTVDGDFGPATKSVVEEFQKRAGLTVDGVCGPKTAAALHISI